MEQIEPIVHAKEGKVPLYVLVYEKLYRLIQSNYFKQGERLPGEHTLAKQLGVSRGSLREALLILQEDGIIYNVQGKGNFLVKNRKNIGPGLEKLCNAARTFNTEEYDDIQIDISFEVPTSTWMQTNLQIKSNMLAMVVNRRYKIKSEFVCLSISFIPYDFIQTFNLDLSNLDEISTFVDETIYDYVTNAKTEIKLTTLGDFLAKKLEIPEDKVLILLEETMFLDSGQPVVFSKSYFRQEFFNFHLNRRTVSSKANSPY
jgi:GntR family transcriptional regulator